MILDEQEIISGNQKAIQKYLLSTLDGYFLELMYNIDVIGIYQFFQTSFNRINNILDQIVDDYKISFSQQEQQSKQLQPLFKFWSLPSLKSPDVNNPIHDIIPLIRVLLKIKLKQQRMPKLKNISQELSNPNIEKDQFVSQQLESRYHKQLQIQEELTNDDHDNLENRIEKGEQFLLLKQKHYSLGLYEQAIEWHDKELTINPQYIDSLNIKGDCLVQLGQYQSAIECYDKALAINPQFAHSLNGKEVCLSSRCQYEQAIECFDKAFKINPSRINIGLFQHCHQHLSN